MGKGFQYLLDVLLKRNVDVRLHGVKQKEGSDIHRHL